MWVDPELDPNDENNYDSINEECLTSEEIDEKAIDDYHKFINEYGKLPEWVSTHPDYLKWKKKNG